MKIYYTRGFEEEKKNPLYRLEIAKFRLGSLGSLENGVDPEKESTIINKDVLLQLNVDYLKNNGISLAPSRPSLTYEDYYDLEAILDESFLTLSIELPKSNVSIANNVSPYNTIFVYYKNYLTGVEDLAFVLFDIEMVGDNFRINPLFLETDRNIIKVPRPSYNCSIEFGMSQDVSFLEGSGLGIPMSLYENIDLEEIRYVSVVSYESYLREKRSEDDYRHLDTTYINKFGLKEY